MNKYNLFTFPVCAIGFFLLPFGAMAAPDVKLYVRSEPVGADIVYHYTLTRSGPEEIRGLAIGVKSAGDYGCNTAGRCGGNYVGTLKVLPIGTTWGPNPAIMTNREFPTLSAGSTTQPAGWTATAGPGRAPGESSEEGSGIAWDLPPWETTYPTPFVQQPTYQFSVRVPAGPVSTTEYMNGFFTVKYRHLGMDHNFYAQMPSADVTPPTLSVTLSPATVPALDPTIRFIVAPTIAVTAAITAADNSGWAPTIRLESMTANGQPYTPKPGNTPDKIAAFGTDDRAFSVGYDNGTTYVVTYSAKDDSGNRTLATGKVVVGTSTSK